MPERFDVIEEKCWSLSKNIEEGLVRYDVYSKWKINDAEMISAENLRQIKTSHNTLAQVQGCKVVDKT